MTLADWLLAVMWVGLTLYVLLGGADFGAGFWDLVAGGAESGRAQRDLIAHSIGPVWEANHVWLIFVVVLLWTGFPSVFAAVSSTLYIPLTLVAIGIIARGSAFAFRKASRELWQQRLFGAAFALSSVLTPVFLGAVAGGIASGRVPPGIATGDLVSSWWNPTSVATGVLCVGVGAYLAAVFLTRDAERAAEPALAEAFRRRALAAGVGVGALAAVGLLVLARDAPGLFDELTGGLALLLVVLSAAAGLVSLALLVARRYVLVRLTAALAVTAILWAWGAAQYPVLLAPDQTVDAATATRPVLQATLGALALGALLLAPSLWWLFAIFQRERRHAASER